MLPKTQPLSGTPEGAEGMAMLGITLPSAEQSRAPLRVTKLNPLFKVDAHILSLALTAGNLPF